MDINTIFEVKMKKADLNIETMEVSTRLSSQVYNIIIKGWIKLAVLPQINEFILPILILVKVYMTINIKKLFFCIL